MSAPWIGFNAARTQDGRPQIDGGCAFLVDDCIYSIAEERISRIKRDGNVWRSLLQGLDKFALKVKDIEKFCVSTCGEAVPSVGAEVHLRSDGRLRLQDLVSSANCVQWIPSHHTSHAWEAVFAAYTVGALGGPALVYVADRVGQTGEHQSTYLFRDECLTLLARDPVVPDRLCGLGESYDRVTGHLGWRENVDAGKTMALAGLASKCSGGGEPVFFVTENNQIRALLPSDHDEAAKILTRYCASGPSLEMRLTDGARLAALLQNELEVVVGRVLETWVDRFRPRAILFGGGVATNCKLLGSISRRFAPLMVQGTLVPGDTGQGIGNLVSTYFSEKSQFPQSDKRVARPCFWPTCFRGAAGAGTIDLPVRKGRIRIASNDADVRSLANCLLGGEIIAVCGGDLEPGPRALGLHSFLADARDPQIATILNESIKRRETFRPFGALITQRAARRYFGRADISPFMDLALPACEDFRRQYPGVVHADGTVRVQSVSTLLDGSLAAGLMKHLDTVFGVEAVVNTSLNIADQPIIWDNTDLQRIQDADFS